MTPSRQPKLELSIIFRKEPEQPRIFILLGRAGVPKLRGHFFHSHQDPYTIPESASAFDVYEYGEFKGSLADVAHAIKAIRATGEHLNMSQALNVVQILTEDGLLG